MKLLEDLFGIKYTDINQFLVKMGTNLLIAILILIIGFEKSASKKPYR
jgi:hypothetical protein